LAGFLGIAPMLQAQRGKKALDALRRDLDADHAARTLP
jgi:hypothetical protein